MERLGEIIVLGATVAGRAAALAFARRGLPVTLVGGPATPEPPLGWYRAWWPGIDQRWAPMVSRGVDLLEALWEESGDAFPIDRRGELWLAADPAELELLRLQAGRGATGGEGPLREHHSPEWYLPSPPAGLTGVPGGLDLLENQAVVRVAVPTLPIVAAGGLHVRRAGGLDPTRFGRWLDQALATEEVTVIRDDATRVTRRGEVAVVSLATGTPLVGAAVVLADAASRAALEDSSPIDQSVAESARCAVRTGLGPPVGGAPALRLRGAAGDWIEILPAADGWHLAWTESAATLTDAADRAGAMIGRAARMMPLASPRPGFAVSVNPVVRAVDRPALVGPIGDGVLVSLAHDGSVTSALVAAEMLAEWVLEGTWPGYLRGIESLAPIRPRRGAARTATD